MTYTDQEKRVLEQRSLENLIWLYQQELLKIDRGENCCILLNKGVRRRLRRCGIILKFGHKYKVTPRGKKMLSVVGDAENKKPL